MKETRIHIENYCLGSSEKKISTLVRCRYSGLPRILGLAAHLIKQEVLGFINTVLSILSIGRTAKFEKDPNFSTITDTFTGQQYLYQGMDYGLPRFIFLSFHSFLRNKMKVKNFKKPTFQNYHFSNKSSPLGDHSMESLLVELIALPSDILKRISTIGGLGLQMKMEYIISNYSILAKAILGYNSCIDKLIKRFKSFKDFIHPVDIFDKDDPFFGFLSKYIRKLSTFAEYEGKTRIIGLVDYWSQAALELLSSLIYQILKAIPQDQTYDQVEGLKDLTFSTYTYYSLDVSAFTDRFPSTILLSLLTTMFDKTYADNIMYILCKIPFWSADLDNFISYSVGNPMGTRAS